MFTTKKCCFCINQRIGCLVLGYICLIAKGVIYLTCRFVLPKLTWSWQHRGLMDAHSYWWLELVSQLILFVDMVLTLALLFELHSGKCDQMKMMAACLLIILVVEIIMLTRLLMAFHGADESHDIILGIIIIAITTLVIYMYFIFSVRCYYIGMKDEVPSMNPEGSVADFVPASNLFLIPA